MGVRQCTIMVLVCAFFGYYMPVRAALVAMVRSRDTKGIRAFLARNQRQQKDIDRAFFEAAQVGYSGAIEAFWLTTNY